MELPFILVGPCPTVLLDTVRTQPGFLLWSPEHGIPDVGVSPKSRGYHFGTPIIIDCGILGSVLVFPYLGKVPCISTTASQQQATESMPPSPHPGLWGGAFNAATQEGRIHMNTYIDVYMYMCIYIYIHMCLYGYYSYFLLFRRHFPETASAPRTTWSA